MTIITHQQIFDNTNLDRYLRKTDNWRNTLFENYTLLSPKDKGVFGEAYTEEYMRQRGSIVSPPKNSDHDRIIDGYKTEIKFSVANSPTKHGRKLIIPNEFMFNHIAKGKDWDRFIFVGINPSRIQPNQIKEAVSTHYSHNNPPPEISMWWMAKADFLNYMQQPSHLPFNTQQGGKNSNNDDYLVAGERGFNALITLPFVHPIERWDDEI